MEVKRPSVPALSSDLAYFAHESRRDTIFAPVTGVGRSAVCVIRMSGPACSYVLQQLAPNVEFNERLVKLSTIVDPKSHIPIDRALVTKFASPRSFTGEDVVELSLTGGRAVVQAVCGVLSTVGLRPAEPGEFCWRAFQNGKIDLSQVEGFADLIEAETEAQRRQAQRIAGGALRIECEDIRRLLLEATAALEAEIDFSDSGNGFSDAYTREKCTEALGRIENALAGARTAEIVRDGFVVVIAGTPNVGKSTLLNALARREVAITSPVPGTTRDPIEVLMNLRGYPVLVIDTAGMRETEDPLEAQGVVRAKARASEADVVIWLSDVGRPTPPPFKSKVLCVRSKADSGSFNDSDYDVAISAKTGMGLGALMEMIAGLAEEAMSSAQPAVVTLKRHAEAFSAAAAAITAGLGTRVDDHEFFSEHLRIAAKALDRVTGRISVEDVLGEIFSKLCIGK